MNDYRLEAKNKLIPIFNKELLIFSSIINSCCICLKYEKLISREDFLILLNEIEAKSKLTQIFNKEMPIFSSMFNGCFIYLKYEKFIPKENFLTLLNEIKDGDKKNNIGLEELIKVFKSEVILKNFIKNNEYSINSYDRKIRKSDEYDFSVERYDDL